MSAVCLAPLGENLLSLCYPLAPNFPRKQLLRESFCCVFTVICNFVYCFILFFAATEYHNVQEVDAEAIFGAKTCKNYSGLDERGDASIKAKCTS